jgi:acyl-coenzyme A synthetase/AMP-(fatty) acid ligase
MTSDEPLPAGYRVIPPRLNIAGEVLDRQVTAGLGDHPAFVWEGGSITYGELQRRVDALARGLSRRGISRRMPVLVRLPNCVEFVVSFLALVKLGAIPVLQNSLLAHDEVDFVLDHSDAVAAITLADVAGPLRTLKGKLAHGLIVARGAEADEASWESLASDPGSCAAAETAADEPAFMVYTSGTTGRPKGIVHAHRWIVALGDTNRWRVPSLAGDIALATGEWSFISALGHNVLFPLRNGTTGAILEGRAQPERVLETVARFRVTLLYSVATVYRRILALPGAEKRHDLSSLRGCSATGEALEEATWREFKQRIGCDIWEHYGISEMQLVLGQGPRQPVRPGSVGRPIPGTRIAIMADDYRELPPGEVGHFLIAADNPGFFLGYHKDPERTRRMVRNGWYHTGDLAWRDADGYVWIAGRSDDCFKSRGIFISPYEIENALRQHPAVAEACVVALPDKEIGNRIRAVLVVRDGEARPTLADEIRAGLKSRIAPYKVPHVIEFAPSLPKSAVGKVLRREVGATRFKETAV